VASEWVGRVAFEVAFTGILLMLVTLTVEGMAWGSGLKGSELATGLFVGWMAFKVIDWVSGLIGFVMKLNEERWERIDD